MSTTTLGLFLRHLALSEEVGRLGATRDEDLLAAYESGRGEAAFTELVRRHGPMVLRTCRRVLGHGPDAEDAFQATFVLLARKADRLYGEAANPLSLGGWLHRVAYQTALNVLSQSSRRRARERQASLMSKTDPDPVTEATWNEVRPILDAELNALPDEARRLLIACYLQGKTHAEAAAELGVPLGSLARRLEKARGLLAERLLRRGITVSGLLLAGLLGETAKGAGVPAVLLVHSVEAARRFTEQGFGMVSENVARLVKCGLTDMARGSMSWSMALVGCVSLLGAGLIACQTLKAWPEQGSQRETPAASAADRPAREKDPHTHVDRYGDPLPPGALARLGTMRLRNAGTGRMSLLFTPDGKGVIAAGRSPAYLWEMPTGKQVHQFGDLSRYRIEAAALSPNGRLLAGRGGPGGSLRLWDLATGKLLAEGEGGPADLVSLTFSPDGKRVVSGGNDKKLRLWDASTGEKQWVQNADFVGAVAFSPDSKTIAALDEHGISLWDAATGEKKSRRWNSARPLLSIAAFSPDGMTLAAACGPLPHAKEQGSIVCLVDVATLQEVRQLAPENAERYLSNVFQSLALAPNGKVLATANGLGEIRFWDTDSGKELRRCQGGRCFAVALAFSPDGKTLASTDGGLVRFWDTASGKEVSSAQGGHKGLVSSIAFTPDGGTLISTSGDGSVGLWDPATGAQRQAIAPAQGDWEEYQLAGASAAIAPDGKTITLADIAWPIKGEAFGALIRQWDRDAGRERSRYFQKLGSQLGNSVILSPDGKTAALVSTEGPEEVQLREAATGKLLGRPAGSCPAFSPDGKLLATATGGLKKPASVFLWDTATTKQLCSIGMPEGYVYHLAFSPQAKMLVTLSAVAGGPAKKHALRLWPLFEDKAGESGPSRRAGSPHLLAEGLSFYVWALAFSPDGRMLALTEKNGTVRVLETVTGKERLRFTGHGGDVQALAFSPDGRRLASGSFDTTILVWDATGRLQDGHLRPARLSLREIEGLWADLAADDANRAGRALWTLAAEPAQTVPFLSKQLQPASVRIASEVIARLVRDLDDDTFEVRDKARKELEKLGDVAELALRQALAKRPSLEVRKRAEELLAEVDAQRRCPFGETLRGLRAVELLEQIGSREARQILKTLAAGAPHAGLTQEAVAALERLKQR